MLKFQGSRPVGLTETDLIENETCLRMTRF